MQRIYRAIAADDQWPPIDAETARRLRDRDVDLLVAGAAERHHPAAWPAAERATLARRRHDALARDLLESRLLKDIVAALTAAAVPCLILKGAAIARTHYDVSCWRIRGDIDLLIPQATLAVAERAIGATGWEPLVEPRDAAASGQRHFVHRWAGAPPLDLHVRLLAPVLDGIPTFAQLWAERRPVPGLGHQAFTLADADALWYGCAHIALHHTGFADVLWLYDLDRLARALSEAGWRHFIDRAEVTRTRGVCATVLARTSEAFGTPLPDAIQAWRHVSGEPADQFLHARSELHIQWLNLRSLRGWPARATWLRAHLLPEAGYMRARYRVRGPLGLAGAHLRRTIGGAVRWLGLAVTGKR